jgi:hypothetical protein
MQMEKDTLPSEQLRVEDFGIFGALFCYASQNVN